MATKNDRAKGKAVEKLQTAFGEDYLGELGGKYYVRTRVDAEEIQVAFSLSVPKTQIEVVSAIPMRDGGFDFSDCPFDIEPPEKQEITPKEDATLAELMARLGL